MGKEMATGMISRFATDSRDAFSNFLNLSGAPPAGSQHGSRRFFLHLPRRGEKRFAGSKHGSRRFFLLARSNFDGRSPNDEKSGGAFSPLCEEDRRKEIHSCVFARSSVASLRSRKSAPEKTAAQLPEGVFEGLAPDPEFTRLHSAQNPMPWNTNCGIILKMNNNSTHTPSNAAFLHAEAI